MDLHCVRNVDDAPTSLAHHPLALENARLRRLCAESQVIIAHHDLLVREGDHRIKNSLQIVASLLGLQERREANPAARQALHTAILRIQAVARIHDELQLSSNNDVVDLGALIASMCKSLNAMASDGADVRIGAEVECIKAPLALAQPLVLAVNELIINALRHAFPNGGGAINVNVGRAGGDLRILVADNGPGLPSNHSESRGYGMKLVRAMVADVGGAMLIENASGARFTLTVPAPTL